jgi:hypothetical protein
MRKSYPVAVLVAALAFGASAASAHRISPGHKVSWGKAGVSLEDYWVDAAECGHAAAAIDLKDTTPAKALVYGSRLLDDASSPGEIISIQQLVAPEIQWNRAATIMRKALESCLSGRGYIRFQLTDSQFRRLRKLDAGSLERRQFLHRLASDPAVLARQAVDRS